MIKIENGNRKYFDKNGKEIVRDCIILCPNGNEMIVYETVEGELGTDATNPAWIDKGWATPCEYGIYPFTKAETEMIEVVAYNN
jgi:hypothetical protein